MFTNLFRRALPLAAVMMFVIAAFAVPMMAGDALYTTDASGAAVNANIFDNKGDVYLNGGRQNNSNQGLWADGVYYFQITDPSGSVLLSTDDVTCRQVQVSDGRIVGIPAGAPPSSCTTGFHAIGTPDPNSGQTPVQMFPFNDTPNAGGEYKAWIILASDYNNGCSNVHNSFGFCDNADKTDNFKIKVIQPAVLKVCKFQDVNLDGKFEGADTWIQGWQFTLSGPTITGGTTSQTTGADGCATFTLTDFSKGGTTGALTLSEPTMAPGPPPFVLQYAPSASAQCWNLATDAAYPCTVNGSVTSAGAPVAPGTVAFEGSATVTVTLHPGDNVKSPDFGNQCFSDSNFSGFASGSCAHMPVFKTAQAVITYGWTIVKSVDKTEVDTNSASGTATFNYTVKVAYAPKAWQVHGDITVTNDTGVDLPAVTVSDQTDVGGACTIQDPADSVYKPTITVAIANGDKPAFHYNCDFASNPGNGVNTGTATFNYDVGVVTSTGTAPFYFDSAAAIDGSVSVTDPLDPNSPRTVKVGDANPTTITYSHTFSGDPLGTCTSHDNTATFTTNDTATTDSSKQTVKVCIQPVKSGALTMGFWQNKNGQGIVTGGASVSNVCKSGTWLRQYAPFQDLSATATCNQVGTYVTSVIKAANASGAAMNAMLKGQMLATALDVYFSDSALGGNKVGAFNGLGSTQQPIGAQAIDLLHIWGSENTSAAFGGATSMTVSQLLTYAASQATSASGGNTSAAPWYGQLKTTQGLAKDTFDSINNQTAYAP